MSRKLDLQGVKASPSQILGQIWRSGCGVISAIDPRASSCLQQLEQAVH